MVEAVSAIATQNLSSDRNSQRLHESIVSCSIKHLEKRSVRTLAVSRYIQYRFKACDVAWQII